MHPIHINVVNQDDSPISSLGARIVQEPGKWTPVYTDLLTEWLSEIRDDKSICRRMGKLHVVTYLLLYTPTILIPVIVSQLRPVYAAEYSFLLDQLLLLSGILAGVCSSYNFGGKIQKLNEIEQGLEKVFQEISLEMFKPEEHRQQPDLFLVNKMYTLETLHSQVPRAWCCVKTAPQSGF
jgi:hypothetical protein